MNRESGVIKVCFGVSCHIPQGTDTASAEKIYRTIYKPLVSTLYNLPSVPFTLHLSGTMIDWLERRHTEFFMILEEMHNRKQLEILGGGYYSPLFPLIPPADRVGQIELLTTSLRRYFGKRPRGAWIPGSAWDPSMISSLSTCGIEYVLLDRSMISSGALPDIDGYTPVIAEDSGKTIAVIPVDNHYRSPGHLAPEELYTELLQKASGSRDRGITVFLDSETIPDLFIPKDNQPSWFERFTTLVANSGGAIELQTPGRYQKTRYFPSRAYVAPGMSPSCISGVFRVRDEALLARTSAKNLLLTRPETMNLYAKMMYVHLLVNQLRGDKARKKNARELLWQAQGGDAWWPQTVLNRSANNPRQLAYKNLILAEKTTRIRGVFFPSLLAFDFDMDGIKEYLCQLETMNIYVHQLGGKIFELDVLNTNRNYCDILSPSFSPEPTCLGSGLFLDHFLSEQELLSSISGDTSTVPDGVFSGTLYQETGTDSAKHEVNLRANGLYGQFQQPLSLRKQYSFRNEGIQVQYILKNESPINLSGYFVIALDLAISALGTPSPGITLYAEEVRVEATMDSQTFNDVSWMQIDDVEYRVKFTLEANENPSIHYAPILSPVTDGGKQKTESRGTRILLYWKTELGPGYEMEKMVFFTIDA